MFAFLQGLFNRDNKSSKSQIVFSAERSVRVPARIDQPFRILFAVPYSQNRQFDHLIVGVTQDRRIFAAFGNNGVYDFLLISKEEVKFATLDSSDITVQQTGQHLCIYVFGKLAAKGLKKDLELGYHDVHTTMDITHSSHQAIFGSKFLLVKKRIRGLPIHIFADSSSV